MKVVIYIDSDGKFRMMALPEWEGLSSNYRIRQIERTMRIVGMPENMFYGIQSLPEHSHYIQTELREFYGD